MNTKGNKRNQGNQFLIKKQHPFFSLQCPFYRNTGLQRNVASGGYFLSWFPDGSSLTSSGI